MALRLDSLPEYFVQIESKFMHHPRVTAAWLETVLATQGPMSGDIYLNHEIGFECRVKKVSCGNYRAIFTVPL